MGRFTRYRGDYTGSSGTGDYYRDATYDCRRSCGLRGDAARIKAAHDGVRAPS